MRRSDDDGRDGVAAVSSPPMYRDAVTDASAGGSAAPAPASKAGRTERTERENFMVTLALRVGIGKTRILFLSQVPPLLRGKIG